MKLYLGVDIGASTVKLGLYDSETGVIGEREDFPSRATEGPQATMDVIKGALSPLLAKNGLVETPVLAVGVCCPTPISQDGRCIYPTNIDNSWKGIHVQSMLSETLGLPTVLLNDGDAAAYREYRVRAAKGAASPCMIQLITGTGLGGAVLIDGKIHQGPGAAGELGHILTDSGPDADPCGCGATGCAETRASLLGLRNQIRLRQAKGNVPEVLQGDPFSVAKKVRLYAHQESPDPEVMKIWQTYFLHLGRVARTVVNTVGADLVVISGGAQDTDPGSTTQGHARFLKEALSWVQAELTRGFPHLQEVRVEWAIDVLPDSACYGAASYAAR